jgi:hypothetical protein
MQLQKLNGNFYIVPANAVETVCTCDLGVLFAMQGFARVQPLQGDLPSVFSMSPWDGGEGVLQEGEEFSLDDIMGDDEL